MASKYLATHFDRIVLIRTAHFCRVSFFDRVCFFPSSVLFSTADLQFNRTSSIQSCIFFSVIHLPSESRIFLLRILLIHTNFICNSIGHSFIFVMRLADVVILYCKHFQVSLTIYKHLHFIKVVFVSSLSSLHQFKEITKCIKTSSIPILMRLFVKNFTVRLAFHWQFGVRRMHIGVNLAY